MFERIKFCLCIISFHADVEIFKEIKFYFNSPFQEGTRGENFGASLSQVHSSVFFSEYKLVVENLQRKAMFSYIYNINPYLACSPFAGEYPQISGGRNMGSVCRFSDSVRRC